MGIAEIDKNFKQLEVNADGNTKYLNPLESPFKLYGVKYNEKGFYERLPYDFAGSINSDIAYLAKHTSGGRIRFSTNSQYLTIVASYSILDAMPHMTLVGNCGFAVCKNTDKGEVFVDSVSPMWTDKEGFSKKLWLRNDGLTSYTLYFPLYNGIDKLALGFDKDAIVEEGVEYENIKPILYYGSSITQGGCASRPDNSYQGFIAKENNVDFINLGFSGSAWAEPEMIDYLAKIDCSIFVFDYDYNAPSVEHLKDTHYKSYLAYRRANPNIPMILISKPDFYNDASGIERLKIIKKTYNLAKNSGDKNIYFIDGRTLFGKDWANCTVDRTHPTDLGFYKMAKRIGKVINKILND